MSNSETQNSEENQEQHHVTLDEAIALAQGHHKAGNFILAERTYKDILRAVPDHYPTTHYLGILLFQSGNFDEALIYIKKATEADPDNADCWSNYGALLTQRKDYEEAIKVFDKVLELKPDHVDAMNNKSLVLWSLERYEEAEAIAANLLKEQPENTSALTNMGMALAKQGKHEEALKIWKKASEINPEDESIWTNWGHTLREMGRIAASEAPCKKAVEINPKNPDALNNLANTQRDMGDLQAAIESYKAATDIKPDFPQAHNNMAIAYLDDDKYQEAAVAARYAVAFKDDYHEAYSNLSKALLALGEYNDAHMVAQRALHLNPDSADPYLDLADVLLRADRLDDGNAALEEAIKRAPDSPRCFLKLGEVKDLMNDLEGAIAAIDKALELSPEMPVVLLKKARILSTSNRTPEAIEILDRLIASTPLMLSAKQMKAEILISMNENDEAEQLVRQVLAGNKNTPGPYHTLKSIKKFKSEDDPDFQAMLEMAERLKDAGLEERATIHFSLSDAYEHMGKYDEAFGHLKIANDCKRMVIPYDTSKLKPTYEGIKLLFSQDQLKAFEGKGFKTDVPVFIVGMPRSGTTLTEQIISSHPDVFGAGELTYMPVAKSKIRPPIDDLDVEQVGREYYEAVRKHDPDGSAKRITDKMPANYMNIGLIASALSDAKIIHCRRNPVDTCLSCYKQNFYRGQYWSYNLEEMAAEYKRYLDMMEYWRSVLPGRIYEIEYEETVGNFEEQARGLIDHVGLEWDDACLSPHKQKRVVLTASKAQVTKPVYKTSVEKWRRYETHLAPLAKELLPS